MKILFLLGIFFTLQTLRAQDEITLYALKSPLGMDWSTPTKALLSLQKNRLIITRRPLGTVFTEIRCAGDERIVTTSFETLDLFNQLVLNQEGLGVLFHAFPGRFESDESLRDELAGYVAEGRVNFITFSLNQGQCSRAQKFVAEYQKKNVARHWGFSLKPREAQGGNSAAFAASVLEVLGMNEEIFKEGWIRTLRVPLSLVGLPLEERRVSFFRLLGSGWAKGTSPYHLLSFWDPELVHDWIGRNLRNFPTTKKAELTGIELDRRHFPVVAIPFWLPQENLKP